MKIREIENVLSAQAEALNQNQGPAFVADLRHYRQNRVAPLAPLLGLAEEAKRALKRVDPRAEFVAKLKTALLARSVPAARPFVEPTWVWVAAGIGGLISLVSVLLIGKRLGNSRRVALSQR